MDLKQLQELGAFVPKAPIKRTVEWQPLNEDGSPKGDKLQFDIFCKRMSFGALERAFDPNRPLDRQQMAAYIADTVTIGDDGKVRLSYQQAWDLDPSLATVFMTAVGEVNGVKKQANGEAEPETKN